jgi:glycolate oxidase
MDAEAFLEELGKIFSKETLLTKPAQLVTYESDALTSFQVRPLAVVLPETQEEVIQTVRLCHDFGVPFVARGSGTSLSGGSLPVPNGIVIALNRLNKIIRLNPENRVAVVECGVVNIDVSLAADSYGLYYAPDPSSQLICTIGGNVAFNSGGAHCLKYGMTSNHILKIKAVLPNGEVVEIGSESLDSIEPDLVGLFVGSEGLFGIALEITLRLLPKPEAYQTVLAAYPSLEAAGNVVDWEFTSLMEVIEESGADEIRFAENNEQRLQIWKGRKSAFSAVGRISEDYLVQDGVVPRSKLGHALGEIKRLGKQYNLRVANVFHAGDGNLHPLILFDGRDPANLERAEILAGEILQMCIDLGGSITGEHGVGVEKLKYVPAMFAEPDIGTMLAIRHELNRGKLLPVNAVSHIS